MIYRKWTNNTKRQTTALRFSLEAPQLKTAKKKKPEKDCSNYCNKVMMQIPIISGPSEARRNSNPGQ
jgi:hypothetical protein